MKTIKEKKYLDNDYNKNVNTAMIELSASLPAFPAVSTGHKTKGGMPKQCVIGQRRRVILGLYIEIIISNATRPYLIFW